MPKMPHRARTYFPGMSLLAGLLFCVNGLLHGQVTGSTDLPEGEGKELVAVACTQCHTLQPVLMLRDGLEGWKNMVQEMVLRGAQLLPEEADTVAQYLSKNFGPGRSPMQTGVLPPQTALARGSGAESNQAVSLPPGAGKDLVQARCLICHDLGRVITVRRSRAEWERITENMIQRGPQATPEQIQTIISYLTAQFGKQTE